MIDLYNYSLLTIFLVGVAAILLAIEIDRLGVRYWQRRRQHLYAGRCSDWVVGFDGWLYLCDGPVSV